ncbi:META domain-containing protein [Alkalimarinus sediminis]|uniref:META domain-containing protein n=1 Tax=Alkalimarinus sediminis TaxID=1632866 RepID=A0A9E8HPE4_9ALTE|nr:META domain-containing protein [Alkalimarinus sediminis]UZW76681.1 META domain-containing protein [Alkalimarinus sediminis]
MKRILSVVTLSVLMSACASIEEESNSVTVKALQHHNWELTHIDGELISVPNKQQKPRLEIGEHFTANGMAGCNNFFGQAALNENGAFRIEKMGLTRKMCPEADMKIEQVMTEVLSSWSEITLTPKNMILKSPTHELTLKLRDWVN